MAQGVPQREGGPGPQLLLVSQDVPRPSPPRSGLAQDQQGPVRHRRLAQRPETGRVCRLFLGELFPFGPHHQVGCREHAYRAHRRASGRAARQLPCRLGLREEEVDARHLRQRFPDLLRQSGDRERSGCAADCDGRDRGADPIEERRRRTLYGRASACRQDLERRQASRRRAARAGYARSGRRKGAHADDQDSRRPFLVAGGPVPVRRRDNQRRRLAHDPFRHARVPLRRRHETGLAQRQDLLYPRLEHHAAPILRGPALPRLALAGRLGAQAPRRSAQEDALELLPFLHRPGAGSLVRRLRRSGPAHPERVLRLDRRPRLVRGLLAEL